MNIQDFREMYITELQEARSLEDLLTDKLPTLAEGASSGDLKQCFEKHLEQTKGHRDRLDRILGKHDAKLAAHKDQAMESLLQEADKMMRMVKDPDLRDAALISSAQRVEHYEIAVYGTLAAYAKCLGLDDDQQELHDILEEERETDEILSEVAEGIVNPEAVESAAR